MNFLAHCLIGAKARGDDGPGLLAGGFIGDFVKGPVPVAMPVGLALGVRLHRRVDAYSNRQEAIRHSCARYPRELRRFAPIVLDIVTDHLLTGRWRTYDDGALPAFTARAYELVADYRDWLGPAGERFFDYARDTDLLARYGDWTVICRSIHSVARRLRREELGAPLVDATSALLSELQDDFDLFFPAIVEHACEWVDEQQCSGGASPTISQ